MILLTTVYNSIILIIIEDDLPNLNNQHKLNKNQNEEEEIVKAEILSNILNKIKIKKNKIKDQVNRIKVQKNKNKIK